MHFRTCHAMEIGLYHTLGALPEPEFAPRLAPALVWFMSQPAKVAFIRMTTNGVASMV